MATLVVTYYLQQLHPDEVRPARPLPSEVEVRRAEVPLPELNRFLYTAVGREWSWYSRLSRTRPEWQEYLGQAGFETWVAYFRGTPAGFYELECQAEGTVEIKMFGLLPAFVGQGIGGGFLTHALHRAWEKATSRVWLHTCTKDHPAALSNYLARGLRIYRESSGVEDIPACPPWPG